MEFINLILVLVTRHSYTKVDRKKPVANKYALKSKSTGQRFQAYR